MLGFRRDAREAVVISTITLQFEKIGLTGSAAVESATKIVDEVLQEFRRNGIDPFKATQGDEYVTRDQYMAPRLAAGLRLDDIRHFWNRPLLLIFAETKMREMFNYIIVHIAHQQGKDLVEAGNSYKRNFPRYGNPAKWNPRDKYNEGLREKDADIFLEFASRIETWRKRTEDEAFERLLNIHGTLNALVRHLVTVSEL